MALLMSTNIPLVTMKVPLMRCYSLESYADLFFLEGGITYN
jgi:hypothetical protein